MVSKGSIDKVSMFLLIYCFAGLIYKGYRPTYFSPSSRTALAEAELVYRDDHLSHSVYIAVPTILTAKLAEKLGAIIGSDSTLKLLIWTTTPWTLLANMVSASIYVSFSELIL